MCLPCLQFDVTDHSFRSFNLFTFIPETILCTDILSCPDHKLNYNVKWKRDDVSYLSLVKVGRNVCVRTGTLVVLVVILEGTEHVVLPLELKVYPREFPAQHGPILHDKGSKYSVYIEVVNEWANLIIPRRFIKPRDDRVLLIICAAYNLLTF